MVIVTGIFDIDPAHLSRLLPAAIAMAQATRTEAGCIQYGFWQDIEDPARIHVYEEWDSRAHLDAHFNTPHMQVWRAALAKGGVLGRDVKTIEGGQVQPL